MLALNQGRHGWQGVQGLGLAWILKNSKRQRKHAANVVTTALWRPCLPKNGRGGPVNVLWNKICFFHHVLKVRSLSKQLCTLALSIDNELCFVNSWVRNMLVLEKLLFSWTMKNKKSFCYQKLCWPFTVWIDYSSDLKKKFKFSAFNLKFQKFFLITETIFSHSRSEQFW